MFNKHIPALDGLRGFAAFWVVLAHMDGGQLPELVPTTCGAYGVFLFFILSGFLMGHLYLSKAFTLRNVTGYAIARAARIVPIYYLVITASFLASLWLGQQFIYFLTAKDFARLLLFVGNKYVFWSIGPEVQFYAVFVGLWWLYQRLHGSGTAALPVAVMAVALILFAQPLFPGTVVFGKLHVFLAGALMAAAVAHLPSAQNLWHSRSIWAVQLATIGLLVALTFTPFFGTRLLNPNGLPHDLSFNVIYGDYRWLILMAVILLVMAVDTPVSRFIFANRLAQLAGNHSFSVYLLHVPVLMGAHNVADLIGLPMPATIVFALLCVVGIGPISYVLVERPSQNWFRKTLTGLADSWILKRQKAEPGAPVRHAAIR